MTERKRYLVTGGSGFIGSAVVHHLVQEGHAVRVLDNHWRGRPRRLEAVCGAIDLHEGDIRDPDAVRVAVRGMDAVLHLAYVNGTEFFYTQPGLVLDVGIRGMLNVLDACRAEGVRELILASSSEVYQTPPTVPTDETAPLSIPDIRNPRYSYGGGKIACELLAMHATGSDFDRVLIFRPHNVYGPDMGWEHVLPQFILRLKTLHDTHPEGILPFPIQGTGTETRAFNYIDDFVAGLGCILHAGEHREIYHIGTMEEIAVADLARAVAACFGREIEVVPGTLRAGGTPRRCPDTGRLAALGYAPRIPLSEGIRRTVAWYCEHAHLAPVAPSPPVS